MKKRIALLAIIASGAVACSLTPAYACACCGTYQVTNVAADDVLNMRAGPGADYEKVAEIPSGSACVIRQGGCVDNWCRVLYADVIGWVNVKYLRFKK